MVPVMWMTDRSVRVPGRSTSSRMRSRVGGPCARHLGLEIDVVVEPPDRLGQGADGALATWRSGGGPALRLDFAGVAGDRSGDPSRTTERSMTHLPTSVRLGRSYMTSRSTSSKMAQAPGTGTTEQGLLGDRLEGVVAELELHTVELEDTLVLLDQRVLWLDQDAHEGVLEDWETALTTAGAR